MQLRELQFVGIRGLPAQHAIKLKPESGLQVLYATTGRGKTVVYQALLALFDHAYFLSVADSLLPPQPTAPKARISAVIENDGSMIKLVKDIESKSVISAVFDAEQGKFDQASNSLEDYVNRLTDICDFPAAEDFTTLMMASDDVAAASSSGGGGASAGASKVSSFGWGDEEPAAADDNVNPDELRRQLGQLSEELMMAEGIEQSQMSAQDLEQDSYDLQREMDNVDGELNKLTDLREKVNEYAPLLEVDRKTIERAGELRTLEKQYERKMYELLEALDAAKTEHAAAGKIKLYHKDFKLYIAAGVMLGGFISAGVLRIQALALVGLLGVLGIGGLIFYYVKSAKRLVDAKDAYNLAEKRREKEERTFKDTVQRIDELQAEYKLISPNDLVELYHRASDMQKRLAQMEEEMNVAALMEKKGELMEQRHELEAKIAKVSAVMRDAEAGQRTVAEIKQQMMDIERKLEMAMAGVSSSSAAGDATGSSGGALSFDELFGRMIEAGANIARQGTEAMATRVDDTVGKWVKAFFGEKFGSSTVSSDAFTVVNAETAREHPLTMMGDNEKVVLTTLLRLGLVNSSSSARPLPLILDDPFRSLDDETSKRVLQLLGIVANQTQVILLTGRRAFVDKETTRKLVG